MPEDVGTMASVQEPGIDELPAAIRRALEEASTLTAEELAELLNARGEALRSELGEAQRLARAAQLRSRRRQKHD